MASNYILQKAEKSFCPACNKSVDLLCTDEYILKALRKEHWFYICWNCKRVFEVAKGEVFRDES